MEKKSFRIRTTTDGKDKALIVNLNQNFDTLEILSLKISQDKIYRSFSADYGVLVGRVIANDGLGISNSKISIFIPISEDDKKNPLIQKLYPYEKVTDKNSNGVKYNLLTPRIFSGATSGDTYNIGSFPNKQQILDNDTYLEVYEKYYKFTTITNKSGDYMIFGVPIGQHIVHMDTDLSDIGEYSYTADAMIANGVPVSLFTEIDKTYTFKNGTDLEQMPQIITNNLSVDIIPLWGDVENNIIGITRLDFKINVQVNPVAYLTFAYGIDDDRVVKGLYNGDDDNDNSGVEDDKHINLRLSDSRPGTLSRMQTRVYDNLDLVGDLKFKAFRYDADGNEMDYSVADIRVINKKSLIDKGIIIMLLPCNTDRMITDEYGNKIPTDDPNKGIATSGNWRIEIDTEKPDRYLKMHIQKNSEAAPFKVGANKVYSTKQLLSERYLLRDVLKSGGTNNERNIHNDGSWINGFLYFGAGYMTDGKDGNGEVSTPNWLIYDGEYYNTETRVIDVTDYLDLLISREDNYLFYPNPFNFATIKPTEISDKVNILKTDNTSFGNEFSSYEPSTASYSKYAPVELEFSGDNYIFLKGLNKNSDCFKEYKKYRKL